MPQPKVGILTFLLLLDLLLSTALYLHSLILSASSLPASSSGVSNVLCLLDLN